MNVRRVTIAIGLTGALLAAAGTAHAAINGPAIAKVLGRSGKMNKGAYIVPIPRSDLHESIDGFALPTAFGFGGWAAFIPAGSHAMLMADFPLKPSEIDAVQQTLLSEGFSITSLHNHFLGETEPIMFMHVMGMGSATALATKFKEALAKTSAPVSGKPAPNPKSGLNDAAIQKIVGKPGTVVAEKVFKIVVGRPDFTVKEMGVALNAATGINSWAAFTGTDTDAAVAGDVVMLPREVDRVIKALNSHGLSVVAVHNHMDDETPRTMFLHYYGRGPAAKLAAGFRAALDQLGRGR